MDVFDESSTHSDEIRGIISTGGHAKRFWLDFPHVKFVCKPLHDFIDSFRRFHRERRAHIDCRMDGEKWETAFQEFDAGVKKDVYQLVSHFDTILSDPNVDWTNQEALGTSSTTRQPPIKPRNQEPSPPGTEEEQVPTILVVESKTSHGKRKREDPEPHDTTLGNNEDARIPKVAKLVARAPRRRRPSPPPSDRILRPRPWRK